MLKIQPLDENAMTDKTRAPIDSRLKDLGDLQGLLIRACPPDKFHFRSIPLLAQALGISPQAIYKWIERDTVPAGWVRSLVELPGSELTLEDLTPYVFK